MKLISPISASPSPPLPLEIIFLILSYLPRDQHTYHACCLVSRSWYSACIPYLYSSPKLSSKNFESFASTLCPPVGSHGRAGTAAVDLGPLVKRLDMSRLVYGSTKSQTARLLRRVRDGMEEFVADSTSFSINSYAPLSKCQYLRSVSLILVTPPASLLPLLTSLSSLTQLRLLRLPRMGPMPTSPLPSSFLSLLPNLLHLDIPQESLLQALTYDSPLKGTNSPISTPLLSLPHRGHPLRILSVFYGRKHCAKLMALVPELVDQLNDLLQINWVGQGGSDDIWEEDEERLVEGVEIILKGRGREREREKQKERARAGGGGGGLYGVYGGGAYGGYGGGPSGWINPTRRKNPDVDLDVHVAKGEWGIFWEDA